jgi:hypothetical protein
MKKLALAAMLFVLFLGTRCQAQNVRAAFFGKHACVSAGLHASRCKIEKGDTLSKDAAAVYGDWHRYPAIKDVNPEIVDANRIYAGEWIVFPDTPSNLPVMAAATPAPSPKAPVRFRADAPKDRVQELAPADLPTPPLVESVIAEGKPAGIALHAFPVTAASSMTPAPEVHADIALHPATAPRVPSPAQATTAPVPAPLPNSRISGYRLVIPADVAIAARIPIGCALRTDAYTAKGMHVHLKDSFARQEGKDVVLYVRQNLPKEPFHLFIAGINDPIDGKMFFAKAETFQGKFPGPHKAWRTIFMTAILGGNGYMLAMTLGPIAGPSVAGGIMLTRSILKHHAESVLENGQKEYSAKLFAITGGGTPPEKDLGQ